MPAIALAGCAHIHTPGFVKRIKERTDTKVKLVWDHDAARAQKNATELNAAIAKDLEQIWSDREITSVVICSETDRHKALVLAAAKAGKHMFVEKPLGLGAKDASAMASAVEKAGVLFQTGYFMRGNPIHLYLREQIQAGHFGKITRIRHSTCHSGALRGIFDGEWRWMADVKQAGCGGYGDLGTHSLDILMWLMGDVDAVSAMLDNGTARYPGCDELGEGILRFKNGVLGTLAASWDDSAHPVSLLLAGTEGHATVFDGKLYFQSTKVAGADGKEPWTKLPEAWPHAFTQFLDAVGGKQDVPLVSVREAAARNVVMEALYESAKKQAWVELRTA